MKMKCKFCAAEVEQDQEMCPTCLDIHKVLMQMGHSSRTEKYLLHHNVSKDLICLMIAKGYLTENDTGEEKVYTPTKGSYRIW